MTDSKKQSSRAPLIVKISGTSTIIRREIWKDLRDRSSLQLSRSWAWLSIFVYYVYSYELVLVSLFCKSLWAKIVSHELALTGYGSLHKIRKESTQFILSLRFYFVQCTSIQNDNNFQVVAVIIACAKIRNINLTQIIILQTVHLSFTIIILQRRKVVFFFLKESFA